MSIADLPKSFPENHANIWRAFYCGVDYKSAQQSMHLTACGRAVWAFCAGFVFGLLACLAVIGGR